MKIEFCIKCGKPKNYTGRDKHLISCCDCEEEAIKKAKAMENKRKLKGGSKMKKLLLGLVLVLILSFLTVLNAYAFPLATAESSWTNPTTTMDGQPINADTALTGNKVYCGKASGVYTVTKALAVATKEFAKDVPLTVGTWYCVITASNKYGEGGYSNEKMFLLEGSIPNAPSNFDVKKEVL